MGATLDLPIAIADTLHEGTPKTKIARVHNRLRRHVGGFPRSHRECPIVGCYHVHFSVALRTGILRVPTDGIGARHCDITIHVVRHAVVGSRLVGIGVRLGDEGVFHLRGTIREKGAEIAGIVSRVFLLFAVGVADFIVLMRVFSDL